MCICPGARAPYYNVDSIGILCETNVATATNVSEGDYQVRLGVYLWEQRDSHVVHARAKESHYAYVDSTHLYDCILF